MPREHNRMCLAAPYVVSDQARVCLNGLRKGDGFGGEAGAESAAPEGFLWFFHDN